MILSPGCISNIHLYGGPIDQEKTQFINITENKYEIKELDQTDHRIFHINVEEVSETFVLF